MSVHIFRVHVSQKPILTGCTSMCSMKNLTSVLAVLPLIAHVTPEQLFVSLVVIMAAPIGFAAVVA